MPSEPGGESRTVALERMLTRARLERRKGAYEAAWRCLDDALLLAPESPEVLEAMGHLNLDEGEWGAAVQCFRRALEIEPGRPACEEGLGTATIEATRAEIAEAQAEAPVDDILSRREPRHALTLSALLPGLGQMYATEFGRGWAFLAAAMPCWHLMFWGVMSHIIPRAKDAPGWYLPFGVTGAIVVHVLAAWDAWRCVERLHDERRTVL